MAQRSKAYRAAAEKIEAGKFYAPAEAVALAKELAEGSKSDPTVEVAMRLGVDPRKADQMVRGTVNLPNGTGKTARVVVFATGDKAAAAEARRCGLRGQRRPHRQDPGRLDGLRRRRGHPGHDGQGGSPGQDPGSS